MKFWLIVPAVIAVALADAEPKADADLGAPHPTPHSPNAPQYPSPAPYHEASYSSAPYAPAPDTQALPPYGYTSAPFHEPAYSPAPVYGHPAPYHPPAYPQHPAPHGTPHGTPHGAPHDPHYPPHDAPYALPKCAHGNPKSYCLEDPEYPTNEIEQAIEYHYDSVQQLYKDVLANTENSIDRLKDIVEETYLCPSDVKYIQPRRAVNVLGKWRIVVNYVKAHYETLSQTARVEHCTTPGSPCPLIPECYETKCLQKSIYHRFLVYDAYDKYLPFSIESFKLPSSCACYNGPYNFEH